MTEAAPREGGCQCGAIRYRIDGPVESVVHCHCTMCRRCSGAPVVTWVTVPRAGFTLTRGKPRLFHSSDHGERAFCPTCGAPISFRSRHRPDEIDVTLGTLDRPDELPAQRHIWTASRLTWLRLDEELPAAAGFTTSEPGD